MKTVPLRYLADINPPSPSYDVAPEDADMLFLPLEAVWADSRADQSRRILKSNAGGYTRFEYGDIVSPKVTPTFQAGRSMLAAAAGVGTSELHVLRARDGVDPRWVLYAVRSKHYLDEGVTAFQGVAGLQRVPAEFVADFRIADLGLAEQRRIADFLDDRVARIDQIIAARQQQLVSADIAFRSIEHELTTTGMGATKNSGIEWMPRIAEDSQLWRVSRAFVTGSGTTPRSDALEYYGEGTLWATTSDLRDNIITTLPRAVTDEAFRDYSALRTFPKGTLLIAMYGATVGRLGILDCEAATNQACCALMPLGPVETRYAFHWLHAQRPHIMTLASGGGQPNISQEVVRSLHIPAPALNTQRELVQELARHQAHAEAAQIVLNRQVNLLQEYKQSLITAAVTGEFDVTTASTKIPE